MNAIINAIIASFATKPMYLGINNYNYYIKGVKTKMKNIKILMYLVVVFVVNLGSFPLVAQVKDQVSPDVNTSLYLLEQETNYEKEQADYVQKNILDRIFGKGKSSIIIDVQLGLETERQLSEAKERTSERKRKMGDIEYMLPGIPNPKPVSQETPAGESKSEAGEKAASSVTTKMTVKKLYVVVVHDQALAQDKVDVVKETIAASLKIDTKRGDELIFRKAKFASDIMLVIMDTIVKPQFLIPVFIALLLSMFLFGPFSSFLKNYVNTLRERGGTEISVDSKLEGAGAGAQGAGAGGGGVGGVGGLTEAEIAEKERKEKSEKEGEEEKYMPFTYISDENLRRLSYIISKETPATIALVLSYLKPEHVREVLTNLSETLQAEVAVNLATARQLTRDEVVRIDADIKQKIDYLVGGIDQLLKVVEQVDRVTRNNIFEYLKNEKPDMYNIVRQHLFLFDDVVIIPDQAMQVVIRDLKVENIARALRGAAKEVMDKFFANMSTGANSLVKEEMEYGKQMTTEQIEEERNKIVETIKKLESDGKIFIREKPRLVLEGVEASQESLLSGVPADVLEQAQEYFNYGANLYNEGKLEEAIQYLEYCISLDPGNVDVYQYLGNAYYSLERYQEALDNFQKALEYNPEDANLKGFVEQLKSMSVVK
ncbi:MAG: hypothetical protein A2252_11925 [Elusimicrobia bacterium RIFOXYA2_FULL_39_19]|nr:MAG: hypothetical protein A2252_11925 [Elusimicrobia bacterium RIFOXYA2_FULL_39_19]